VLVGFAAGSGRSPPGPATPGLAGSPGARCTPLRLGAEPAGPGANLAGPARGLAGSPGARCTPLRLGAEPAGPGANLAGPPGRRRRASKQVKKP